MNFNDANAFFILLLLLNTKPLTEKHQLTVADQTFEYECEKTNKKRNETKKKKRSVIKRAENNNADWKLFYAITND